MTSSVQQHIAIANNGTSKRNRKSYMFSQNIYQVEVNGDVGSHRLKLAVSEAKATATAEIRRKNLEKHQLHQRICSGFKKREKSWNYHSTPLRLHNI